MVTSKSKLPTSISRNQRVRNKHNYDSGRHDNSKNALPILTYFDIFKNYYANTQEESFYMIGSSPKLTTTINGINITNPDNIITTEGAITGGSRVTILPTTLKENEIKFRVKTSLNAREQILAANQLGNIEIAASKWSLTKIGRAHV